MEGVNSTTMSISWACHIKTYIELKVMFTYFTNNFRPKLMLELYCNGSPSDAIKVTFFEEFGFNCQDDVLLLLFCCSVKTLI